MATLDTKLKNFGVREVWVAELDEVAGTYNPIKRCEGIQQLNVEGITSSYQLEGDDVIKDTFSVLEGYTWSINYGVLDFETLAIFEGGTVVTDAEGNSTYTNNSSDKRPYFALIGRVVGNTDLKVILPKCRAEGVNQSYQTKQYAVVSANGTAIENAKGDLRILKTDNTPIAQTDIDNI